MLLIIVLKNLWQNLQTLRVRLKGKTYEVVLHEALTEILFEMVLFRKVNSANNKKHCLVHGEKWNHYNIDEFLLQLEAK